MIGISKVTFHTGLRFLLMDGVDCLEGPNSTTRNYSIVRMGSTDCIQSMIPGLTGSLVPLLSLAAKFLAFDCC